MKLCRFKTPRDRTCVGIVQHGAVCDLGGVGIGHLTSLLDAEDAVPRLRELAGSTLTQYRLADVKLLPPIEQQEVWAAGVTYQRSKTARMDESAFSANAYDQVYAADRPELFFKSLPEKVVGPEDLIGIRQDARWSVPEPELALMINPRGAITGFTIGNDMSSRDLEGANLLYLPQAKVYHRSCALGPWIVLGATEEQARSWTIALHIQRDGAKVFSDQTSVDQIKRPFPELVEYLYRSQQFPNGAVLLTGTGIVPPDDLTLQPGDLVEMEISGIGTLRNTVVQV